MLRRPTTSLTLLPLIGVAGLASCGSGSNTPGSPDAPSALAYPTDSLRVPSLAFVPELAPTLEGGAPSEYRIAPALPAGLELGSDGVLRGAPTETLEATRFTITASNDAGETSTELLLEIDASFSAARFLHVSNYDDHTLSTFLVTEDGELRHHGYTAADPNPAALAASPTGQHLYSAHPANALLSVYRSNPDTGAVERVDQVTGLPGTLDLLLDADAEWLYAAHTGGIATFRAAGADTLDLSANLPAAEPVALALHPAGHTLYAALFDGDAIGAFSVAADGSLSELESEAAGLEPAGLIAHPNGELLFASHSGDGIVGVYAIAQDGYLEKRFEVAAGTQPTDLALNAAGDRLFVTDLAGEALLAFDVDPFDGMLTNLSTRAAADAPFALELDASGEGVFVTHLDTSDVGHWSESGAPLSELNRVRTRGGAADAVLVEGPSALSVESTLAFSANRDFGDLSTLSLGGDGLLTETGQPVTAGGDPFALSFDPGGGRLYAVTQNGDLSPFEVDGALAGGAGTILAGGAIEDLIVDPSGRFVFTAGAAGLESFAIEADGSLTASESLLAGDGPRALAAEPGGLYLYVLNRDSGDVSGFWIHGVTGRLEELEDSPYALGAGAVATHLAVHPNGRFLYAADEDGDSVFGFTIAVDGGLTPLANAKVVDAPEHLAFAPRGDWLFATSVTRSEVTLCEVDRLTGTLTTRSVEGGLNGPSSVHVDASGNYAYVADTGSDRVSVFDFDTATGELDLLQDLDLGSGAAPVEVVTNWQLVAGD